MNLIAVLSHGAWALRISAALFQIRVYSFTHSHSPLYHSQLNLLLLSLTTNISFLCFSFINIHSSSSIPFHHYPLLLPFFLSLTFTLTLPNASPRSNHNSHPRYFLFLFFFILFIYLFLFLGFHAFTETPFLSRFSRFENTIFVLFLFKIYDFYLFFFFKGNENHGVYVCHKCGWPFPNPHPSAKHRRAHKKICGTIEGYKEEPTNFNGSDVDYKTPGMFTVTICNIVVEK